MCAQCRQTPCDPRCPNAEEPEPAFICGWGGEKVWDNLAYDMEGGILVCRDCVEKRARYL